ncbi:MAG: KaiC domain-containing protein [bacterium]|nr:KaiC domain-containing protein [bacterium]
MLDNKTKYIDNKKEYNLLQDVTNEDIIIHGIDSGIEYINKLFYYSVFENSKPVLKPVNGYPKGAVINITGEADTGKSLLVQTALVINAHKNIKGIYISTENPLRYVSTSLKRISLLLSIDFNKVKENIKIVDLTFKYNLINNIDVFLKNLYYQLNNNYKGGLIVFDSLTGFYESKEVMARYIVRRIFQFCKNLNLTAFLISQKREDSPFSSKAAGGMAISHIADCNIVLSKIIISNHYEKKLYEKEIGQVIRTFRIDGCRLCGHSSKTHIFEIDKTGLINFVKFLG